MVVRRELTLAECIDGLSEMKQYDAPPPQKTPTSYRYILHLYSGVRRQGDFHTYMESLQPPDGHSFYVASVDLVLHARLGDLLDRKAQNHWLDMAAQGAVYAVLAGPPCESWSVARFRFHLTGEGPKPIRSGHSLHDEIWGLRTMRIRDVCQADVANQLLLFMALLIIIQWTCNGLAILEHPELPEVKQGCQPPSIWILPIFKFLMSLQGIHVLHIYQGFWGARSPKPTALLVVARGAEERDLYTSLNRTKTRSTLPRALEMGKTDNGKSYNTAALKRYPPALCEGLSFMLYDLLHLVPSQRVDMDSFQDVFDIFARAYHQSFEQHDGQDYVPHEQKHTAKLGASNPP